jgi:hypothetical protein
MAVVPFHSGTVVARCGVCSVTEHLLRNATRTLAGGERMDLRVEDLPLLVDRSLYQEAIDTYLELSHKYIETLYVFGTIDYPGLSDLDFLVVPKDTYLAPLRLHLSGRLPRRFDPIIEHEVFVVPTPHLQAFRYMGYMGYMGASAFRLAYGPDVLAGIAGESSVETRLCETLELVHNKLVFLANLRRTGVLNARSCIRLFKSHRYNVRRLAELGLMEENGYGNAIDALRTQFVAAPSAEPVVEMYHVFEEAVGASARTLHSFLAVDPLSVPQVAAVSQGRVTVPFQGYRVHDARERAEVLTTYLQELVRRNYWYGFPFPSRLFPPPVANSPFERALYRYLRSGSRRWRRLRFSRPATPPSQRLRPSVA